MRTRAIVNPHSSGKKTGARWPEIEKKLVATLGPMETVFTDAPMDAVRLTSEALREGVEQIISVGGDGTINEVVNGFFDDDELINDEAVLCILTSGTGGDFRKTFDIPEDIRVQILKEPTTAEGLLAVGQIPPLFVARLGFSHSGVNVVSHW